MLFSSIHNRVVASCGWTDRSSLLVIDTDSREVESRKIGDSEYITLKPISSDHFVSAEHYDGFRLVLSVRSFETPAVALAQAIVTADSLSFSGDDSLWKKAPRYWVDFLKHGDRVVFSRDGYPDDNYRLIDLRSPGPQGLFPSFKWFDDSYDHAYQGIVDVFELPDSPNVLVSIQRDSEPVIHNPVTGRRVGTIPLAGRGGNPKFSIRASGSELWCVDYDTLVKIAVPGYAVRDSRRLQLSNSGTTQFIGGFSFSPDETLCAVARPFSGDVLLLETGRMKTVATSPSSFQPLSIVMISDSEYITRDWKTGTIEFGRF